MFCIHFVGEPGSSVGIEPDSCKMGIGSFPVGKARPGRATDHSPPSSAAVMEEQSYNSTHSLGPTVSVTESLYIFFFCVHFVVFD